MGPARYQLLPACFQRYADRGSTPNEGTAGLCAGIFPGGQEAANREADAGEHEADGDGLRLGRKDRINPDDRHLLAALPQRARHAGEALSGEIVGTLRWVAEQQP